VNRSSELAYQPPHRRLHEKNSTTTILVSGDDDDEVNNDAVHAEMPSSSGSINHPFLIQQSTNHQRIYSIRVALMIPTSFHQSQSNMVTDCDSREFLRSRWRQ
jgi:hypothetical protein